jgi:hypothetical protein
LIECWWGGTALFANTFGTSKDSFDEAVCSTDDRTSHGVLLSGNHPTCGGLKMPKHRIFTTSFASVYPLYVQKAERKNRAKEEVDQIICWLTGYDRAGLHRQIKQGNDFETFFAPSHSSE